MKLFPTTPSKSINKAYLKQSLKRQQIETFKSNLGRLFNRINEDEREEHLKNIVSDFLKETYYKETNEINTKDYKDLVIHNGKSASDTVGVIIETKRPGNKAEMVSKSEANVKAMHELVLYYLDETVGKNNHEIKHLIATNIWDWFVFDAVWFEKNIFRNTKLIKDYENWKVTKHDTQHFFEHIAAKHLDKIEEKIPCTHFNLKEFEPVILNDKKDDDVSLVHLYKILSPEHLLKKPFVNDSNSLNKEFYSELLHIIGLTENKDGGKKTIERKKEEDRNNGSLLENTIRILKVNNKLKKIGTLAQYGETEEEQLFSVGLELCITWLNRILFLKLLEGQLVKYHRGDKEQSFLNTGRIEDYDELNEMFFEVLAVPIDERERSVQKKFGGLPYLNSSLFEETALESDTIVISALKGRFEIPFYSHTVLKDSKGKRLSGEKKTLEYLFEFLDAFDFASDSGESIQEENKTMINASVLGLIFEKINGYKDGSFFTPGFITMYMCRETIRKAVVQKFKEVKFSNLKDSATFDDLKDTIEHTDKAQREKANEIINSLKICDPAVGSGHFLVSALNEIIAIKSELQILNYRDGSRIKGYKVVIENDELIITNEEDDHLFDYKLNANDKPIDDLQKLQEALFHEKQTIIENCLFGVDINPKSVMICRLRLWIELLKNAYYTGNSKYKHLETLPNIDINIKCGNSLISRFTLGDKQNVLPGQRQYVKQLIEKYKIIVSGYKNAYDKNQKDEFRKQISNIRNGFENFVVPNDKDYAKLKEKEKEASEIDLFALDNKKQMGKIAEELADLRRNYTEKVKNLYGDAFEWRFEFPEVLDDDGKFVGFDVVIGNPPYGVDFRLFEKQYFVKNYTATDDIYTLFLEKGKHLTTKSGFIALIIPVFWLTGEKYFDTRKFVSVNIHFDTGITLPYDIFTDAYVDTGIFLFSKTPSVIPSKVYEFQVRDKVDYATLSGIRFSTLDIDVWTSMTDMKIVFNAQSRSLLKKLSEFQTKIEDIVDSARGILADAEDYSNTKVNKNFEPIFVGKIDRYFIEKNNFQYIKYGDNLREKPTSFDFFIDERILVRRIVNRQFRIMATLTHKRFVTKKDVYIFKSKNSNISHKYLLAIINSKLISFVKTSGSASAKKDDFTQITLNDIRQISIPNIDKSSRLKFEKLVDKILEKKQKISTVDTSGLEKQIDEMVYEIYGLTEEEIKIVEGKK